MSIYFMQVPFLLCTFFSLIQVHSINVASKVKSSARRAIKRDVNPLYGVDYEDQDDKNRQSNSVDNYDYMGN